MNSTKIADSYFAKEEEFNDIKNKSQKIFEIRTEISTNNGYLKKMYGIIFKNLVSKKVATTLKFKSWGSYEEEIFFTKDGITTKSDSWGINTTNINNQTDDNFINALKKISENVEKITPLLRNDNIEKLKSFLERFDLVIPDKTFTKDFKETKLVGVDEESYSFIQMASEKPSEVKLMRKDEGEEKKYYTYHSNNISLSSQSLRDKIFIEQIYDELVEFLDEYRAREELRLKNLKEYVKIIDEKFSNYVMLAELSKSGKGENA